MKPTQNEGQGNPVELMIGEISSVVKEKDPVGDMMKDLRGVVGEEEKDPKDKGLDNPEVVIFGKSTSSRSAEGLQNPANHLVNSNSTEYYQESKEKEATVLGVIFDFFDALTFGLLGKAYKAVFGEQEEQKVTRQYHSIANELENAKATEGIGPEIEKGMGPVKMAPDVASVTQEEENEKSPKETLLEILDSCKDPEKLKQMEEIVKRYMDENKDNPDIQDLAKTFLDKKLEIDLELNPAVEKDSEVLGGESEEVIDSLDGVMPNARTEVEKGIELVIPENLTGDLEAIVAAVNRANSKPSSSDVRNTTQQRETEGGGIDI
jgi:hypothetical protein